LTIECASCGTRFCPAEREDSTPDPVADRHRRASGSPAVIRAAVFLVAGIALLVVVVSVARMSPEQRIALGLAGGLLTYVLVALGIVFGFLALKVLFWLLVFRALIRLGNPPPPPVMIISGAAPPPLPSPAPPAVPRPVGASLFSLWVGVPLACGLTVLAVILWLLSQGDSPRHEVAREDAAEARERAGVEAEERRRAEADRQRREAADQQRQEADRRLREAADRQRQEADRLRAEAVARQRKAREESARKQREQRVQGYLDYAKKLMDRGENDKSRERLQEIVRDYSDTPQAQEAERLLAGFAKK
jgi:hypothetical protein